MKTYSLTRRLIVAVLLVEACSTFLLIASAGVYEGVSRFRAFDVMLRGRADSLVGAVQDAGDEQDNVMLDGTQLRSPQRDIYAVRDDSGRILGQSANWSHADAAFQNQTEFQDVLVQDHRYRLIRLDALRTVDPGEKGGVVRHVVVLYGARTHPVWKSILHAIAFYAVLSSILLCLSFLIMQRLLRHGIQPLQELAGQAAKVSVKSWDFRPSDKVRQVRELEPLAVALETVLTGLEQSFERQRQFVGDAAHELKTSVAVVKSSLQLLLVRERDAIEYRKGIERAEHDCERMEALTASMLTLAALEAAPAETSVNGVVNCSDILADVVAQFETMAELAGIEVVLLADPATWVEGEREWLQLLWSNLLHNALQHSPSGSEIQVLARVIDGQVEIRVEDRGEGIAGDVLPHVFDRFYRGDISRSRRTGGTGLGLAISKAIVEKMKGRFTIESQIGIGTQGVVIFPLKTAKQLDDCQA